MPGDGIGPEVCAVARRCVDAAGAIGGFEVTWEQQLVGGAAMDATGEPLPAATLIGCGRADAVLLGAVGGPAWDDPAATVRPEDALLGLRSKLELFANLRPVRAHPALAAASPLRPEVRADADLLIVRELTGGLYFGRPQGREIANEVEAAVDTLRYTRPEIERIVELAFRLARERRGHLTSVDKANVLASSRLWREVVDERARRHPDVAVEHALVDSTAYLLMTDPRRFDVIVTENLFGDILSDEAAAISGSLGLLSSASLGTRTTARGTFGMYEPVHGSAPQIAGRGVANPLATVASAALMLRHSLGEPSAADALDAAVDAAIESGPRTADLGGVADTDEVAAWLLERIGSGAEVAA
ncbi:MAG: 3-isopropylmalate dehydrogenase [Chloroflexi bacterium]|nr:3-isopropylmalate dehydrogenase [Chloroflexota bacterium]